jgi:hypothetical protein
MRTGAEKPGLQTLNEFDAVAVKGLKTAQWINGQVQRVHDIQEGVPNNANNVNDVRNTIQGIGALSEHGADRNATNNVRRTFLHIAASYGKLAAVRLLAEHGVDVRVKNDGGWTPLAEAVVRGYSTSHSSYWNTARMSMCRTTAAGHHSTRQRPEVIQT